ncbi:hypothetical protein D3C75_371090 [compost metagenome]
MTPVSKTAILTSLLDIVCVEGKYSPCGFLTLLDSSIVDILIKESCSMYITFEFCFIVARDSSSHPLVIRIGTLVEIYSIVMPKSFN